MRTTALALFLVLFAAAPSVGETPSSPKEAFQSANLAYKDGDFQKALVAYQSILDSGLTAPELEFNVGNAYLKGGAIGQAILHYRRALKMDSGLKAASINLAFARKRTRDLQQNPAREAAWFSRFGSTTTKAAWMLLVSVSILCLFGIARILFWPNRMAGTILSGILAGLVLLSLVALLYHVSSEHALQEGVLLAEEVEVRSGPGQEFTVHFRLHEGSEVELIRESAGWREIKISDELQGWIPVSSVAAI